MRTISRPAPTPTPISVPCRASAAAGNSQSSDCSSPHAPIGSVAMKKIALSLMLCALPVAAQAADSAWVQAVQGGFEARLVTDAAGCPLLRTDEGDVAMSARAAAGANFALVCDASVTTGT